MGGTEEPIEVAHDSIEQAMHTGGTDAIDLDEIEEVPVDDLEEVDSQTMRAAARKKKRGPTVMLEKPVDESDAETHYDLGLAYKEMGLYDEAIKAFEKALRAPGREVRCRLMIGMCHREQGNAVRGDPSSSSRASTPSRSERERQSASTTRSRARTSRSATSARRSTTSRWCSSATRTSPTSTRA